MTYPINTTFYETIKFYHSTFHSWVHGFLRGKFIVFQIEVTIRILLILPASHATTRPDLYEGGLIRATALRAKGAAVAEPAACRQAERVGRRSGYSRQPSPGPGGPGHAGDRPYQGLCIGVKGGVDEL